MNSNSVVLSPWLSRTWWVSWESAMSGIWRSFIFDSQRLFTDLPSERPFTCGPRHLRFHNTKIHWWFQNHQKMSRNIGIFSENHILYKPQRFMGDSLAFKPHATSLSSKFWFHRAEGAFSTLPLTSIGGFWNFLTPTTGHLWVFENFHTGEPSLIFKLAGFVAMGVNNK